MYKNQPYNLMGIVSNNSLSNICFLKIISLAIVQRAEYYRQQNGVYLFFRSSISAAATRNHSHRVFQIPISLAFF
ncbi:hypothetical protein Hanom_Chr08g00716081 [Helianthus anomalus]